jgi:hypothetical protein
MDSIRIDTGEKRIMVNDDPKRVIVFTPTDVIFAEKFYALIGEVEEKLADYKKRAEELDNDKETDSHDVPVNLLDRLSLLREACEYIRAQIDELFGAGTSQAAFGDAMTMGMFEQFFSGITPFIKQARSKKIERYTTDASAKRDKRK